MWVLETPTIGLGSIRLLMGRTAIKRDIWNPNMILGGGNRSFNTQYMTIWRTRTSRSQIIFQLHQFNIACHMRAFPKQNSEHCSIWAFPIILQVVGHSTITRICHVPGRPHLYQAAAESSLLWFLLASIIEVTWTLFMPPAASLANVPGPLWQVLVRSWPLSQLLRFQPDLQLNVFPCDWVPVVLATGPGNPSKNLTRQLLAGQTRTRTRQPAGFGGFG